MSIARKTDRSKAPTQLLLIRHGQTQWSAEKRFQGRRDTELTARGREEMRRLALRLGGMPVDAFYTSSLKRARESAAILCRGRNVKTRVDSRLNELWFGKWEGQSAEELRRQSDPFFKKWCAGKVLSPPGGESLAALRRRVTDFLREIRKRHAGGKIAVVSHGGIIRMILLEALGLRKCSFWSLRIDAASLSVVCYYPHFAQIARLNDCCHLEAEG